MWVKNACSMVFLSVVMVQGCAAAPEGARQERRVGEEPKRTLIGLEDDSYDVWRQWVPQKEPVSVPEAFKSGVVAFDFWRVEDEAFRVEAWEVVFSVLSTFRTVASEAPGEGMTLLMSVYDPAYAGAEIDVTFVFDREQLWEGVLVRLWMPFEETTLGTSVLLRRHVDGAQQPFDVHIWGVTGFEDNRGFTASLEPPGALALEAGLVWPLSGDAAVANVSAVAYLVLVESLWKPLTGHAYVESTIAGEENGPGGFAKAAGLEVRERAFEEMFTHSVFPPRIGDLGF